MDPKIVALIDAWHWSYLDFDLVFQGLSQENLVRRPHPNCLAICEHVAHIMRSEASIVRRYLFGEPEELWADHWMLKAPFGWPPDILAASIDPRFGSVEPEELKGFAHERHNAMVEYAEGIDLPIAFGFADDWADAAPTVEVRLRFAAYHVGYHVGQMYQTRHLLGDETPEN
jgi:hypothetical protein